LSGWFCEHFAVLHCGHFVWTFVCGLFGLVWSLSACVKLLACLSCCGLGADVADWYLELGEGTSGLVPCPCPRGHSPTATWAIFLRVKVSSGWDTSQLKLNSCMSYLLTCACRPRWGPCLSQEAPSGHNVISIYLSSSLACRLLPSGEPLSRASPEMGPRQ